jgi:D-arabinose 1-dehydrogenase-like Zn-dependent alcohol dehydrogenase
MAATWTTADGRDRLPVVPSHEVSGVVDTASPAASEAAVGETVYGLLTSGLAVAA